jgi:hypothetical protein
MSDEMLFLFGSPLYKSKVNQDFFKKKELIELLANNYNLGSNRNNWDDRSFLHHTFNDDNNSKFKTIDNKIKVSLCKAYQPLIENFFKTYLKKEVKYKFNIVNFTCMSQNQFMIDHAHPGCEFSAVHYLKFNEQLHKPTVYVNPSNWAQFRQFIFSKGWLNALDSTSLDHSWMFEHFHLNIKEDDFVITPGVLKHFVPPCLTDELRMTVVVNIHIL